MNEKKELRKLMEKDIAYLNKAAKAYYIDNEEIISNYEYDKKYDELVELEKKLGIALSNSPTQNVGYSTLGDLPKEEHRSKMLSLDKTKSVEDLISWMGSQECLISWKLDGLTIVLTYEEGKLTKAITRGNGLIGEVVTNNAKVFANIPLTIPYKEHLTLRGEAIITYSQFKKINETIPEMEAKYKNPRNLCSGSVRQLNNKITKDRNIRFIAFGLVDGEELNTRMEELLWLDQLGFEVVYNKLVREETIEKSIEDFSKDIHEMDYPSDGLVLTYNNIAYGKSLGETSKFPRDAIAFKWEDEVKTSKIKEIEWSASRTGLINPIAIFEPVDLEGTTVSRASVHNISILEELKLGIGDEVDVYKANMIIPQIEKNLTKSGPVEIPSKCPICQTDTILKNDNGIKTLNCPNPKCPAKKVKTFTLFVSRDAMNVDGLSAATIEKFTSLGLIKRLRDIFHLDEKKDEIIEMEGFGEKSYINLIEAINKSRETKTDRFLYGLGIAGIGSANAKLISNYCHDNWQEIQSLTEEKLIEIEGIGPIIGKAFVEYFEDEDNRLEVEAVLEEISFKKEDVTYDRIFQGMTFVITGSLEEFENRKQLKEFIEARGGKVASAVSSNTSYLINNDVSSNSSKNKTARKLNLPIISEEEFIKKFGVNQDA